MSSDKQTWYFTFGSGQPHANRYVVIVGTYDEARDEMNRRFNRVWGFQYDEDDWHKGGISQAEKYGIRELR